MAEDTERISIVRDTLDRIASHEAELSQDVYDRMFERHPETAELFGPHSRLEQRQMVRMTLVSVYEHLLGEAHVPAYVAGIGVEHDVLAVTEPMYETFTECMLEGCAALLGEAWSAEHQRIWRAELDRLSAAMRDGAKTWG